jgi:hypothetical protein
MAAGARTASAAAPAQFNTRRRCRSAGDAFRPTPLRPRPRPCAAQHPRLNRPLPARPCTVKSPSHPSSPARAAPPLAIVRAAPAAPTPPPPRPLSLPPTADPASPEGASRHRRCHHCRQPRRRHQRCKASAGTAAAVVNEHRRPSCSLGLSYVSTLPTKVLPLSKALGIMCMVYVPYRRRAYVTAAIGSGDRSCWCSDRGSQLRSS